MKVLLFLLPLSTALIFKFLQNNALDMKTFIHKTYPTAEEALKGPEKARVWTRPSDGKDLEYFGVYSTDRNEGRDKTAIVVFHPSWASGYLPCRYKFSAISSLISVFSSTDITLICPTFPGYGGSHPPKNIEDPFDDYVNDVISLLNTLGFKSYLSIGWGFGSTPATAMTHVSSDLEFKGTALLQPTLKSNISRRQNGLNSFENVFPVLTSIFDSFAASSLLSTLQNNQTPALHSSHHNLLSLLKTHTPSLLPLFITDTKRVLAHTLYSQMTDLKNNIVDVNSLLLTYCHTPNKKITSTQDTSECHRITSSLKGSIDFDYDSEVEIAAPLETAVYELLKRGEEGGELRNSNSI
ncbi:hypothetical protein TrST_g10356 [Triparma strigata]|uniref:AB hydrolase-1 domain-containing protein n=1 Tax=Triparma strigata TaxID=1606541 RepID=A0A9W7B2I7_9STRA|nr:hypothetical protein TrST_g10356 [Triparma strigata]